MALTEFHNPGLNPGDTYDMGVIAALHDEPNVDDGLSAAQLKAKFDEGGTAIQTYINGTLKTFVDGLQDGTGLADGSVTHPKLATDAVEEGNIKDGAVTTDKIYAAAVTKNKLSLDVRAAVAQAEVSYEKPSGGIPKTDLASAVQTSLGKADSAYQKPGTGIPDTDLASAVTNRLIPSGGTSHQMLMKKTSADYDLIWDVVTTQDIGAISEPAQASNGDLLMFSNGSWDAATPDYISAPASPNSRDILTYSGGAWVAAAPENMDIVVTPNSQPSDGDVLYYDGNDSEWKADTPANAGIHSVPSGGSSGYVLKKASGTDYDVEWAAESGGGGGTPYTSNPAALGTASPGSSDNYARGDHVHPKPTAADLGITVPSAATATPSALGTAAVGSSTKYAKEDHVHDMPSASDVGAVAVSQGVAHAGEFVVVGSDGNITTVTMTAWSGGNY